MSRKQKIEDVILFQLDLTSKISKQYSQRDFDKLKLGITVEQWVLLKIISESSELTQKELATKSYRDPASITRTLDILEKKGMVSREVIPRNRRSYHILLSNTGKQFIEKNLDLIIEHRENSINGISKKELTMMSSILAKMRENMK
jgi:DNA-binding MarR family transcriptional regulator